MKEQKDYLEQHLAYKPYTSMAHLYGATYLKRYLYNATIELEKTGYVVDDTREVYGHIAFKPSIRYSLFDIANKIREGYRIVYGVILEVLEINTNSNCIIFKAEMNYMQSFFRLAYKIITRFVNSNDFKIFYVLWDHSVRFHRKPFSSNVKQFYNTYEQCTHTEVEDFIRRGEYG